MSWGFCCRGAAGVVAEKPGVANVQGLVAEEQGVVNEPGVVAEESQGLLMSLGWLWWSRRLLQRSWGILFLEKDKI